MIELILENVAKHIELCPFERDQFIALLQPKVYQRHSVVLQAGDIARDFIFVAEGCLRMYSTDSDGKEYTILFAPEDWWCVDHLSFHTQSPACYTIQALENSNVLQINRFNLTKLYQQVPKFERFFRILFQNGFVLYQQRITSNLMLSAADHYQQFQQQYPKLQQRLTQKQIASYLGVTPEFLSMVRRRQRP